MQKILATIAALSITALAVWSFGSATSAEAQGPCDRLTGRDRSRCLADERRDRSGSGPQAPREGASPAASRPAMPRALSPGAASAPGQVLSGNRVTIAWAPVDGATEYDFGIRDTTTNTMLVDTRSPRTSYTAVIERGRSYRWNVRACNKAGCSAFTAPLHFQSEGARSVGAITLPTSFPLYNQHVATTSLYQSVEWANAIDTVDTKSARKDLACLAAVYAMIEHARGNRRYRIGPATWTDQAGPYTISGISGDKEPPTADVLLEQMRQGNPVILWGPYGGYGHYVLAVGTDANGQIIIHDPSGGLRATVNPQTWRVSGSNVLSRISKYRTVSF